MTLGDERLTCYIDALDECGEAEIRDMIEFFEELTESAIEESVNFRVCFSSCHYPRILINTCLELILEGQEGHEGDIAAYIQKKLRVSARSKSAMAVEIQERADVGKIKTRLKEIPDGLDKLFQDIITRGTRDDTYLIPTLQWIIEHERISAKNAEHFLLNSTKGLAETSKGKEPKVQFIHESVQDYLGTTSLKSLAPHLIGNLPGSTHNFLKQRCLELVSEGAKSGDAEKLRARSKEDLPFLEYAISNVLYHTESAASELEMFVKTAVEKRAPRVLELLIEAGDQLKCGKILRSLLVKHSRSGNKEVVRFLLDKGADVNAQGREYSNALQAASARGHNEIVQQLLDKGADVNTQGGHHGNALQAASAGGYKEIVQQLLDKGADVNARGRHYGDALQATLARSYKEIVQQLLDKGADVNARGGHYGNALQAASAGGYKEIVQQLLDKGADVNAQGGHYGDTL
ncbi:hypothetical protein Q7P35_005192 [Cladosporium inversicolor]